MRIKIVDCSDPMMWYSKRINEEFTVVKTDSHGYWCREGGFYNSLNWIHTKDAEVIDEQ